VIVFILEPITDRPINIREPRPCGIGDELEERRAESDILLPGENRKTARIGELAVEVALGLGLGRKRTEGSSWAFRDGSAFTHG
jgi:hypothetical protein